VLLLDAPVASRPVRVEPVEEVIPANASEATPPLREERAERVEGPRRPSRTGVAALAGALLFGGALGLFVGHRTNGGAAAEVVRLQTGLADAATAQAALADQVSAATARLKAQKESEPLRRLAGKRVGEIQIYAQTHGWRLRVQRVRSARPSGTVLTQAPPPGHVMKQGGTIVVRVAG
jgi:hypothetical protein